MPFGCRFRSYGTFVDYIPCSKTKIPKTSFYSDTMNFVPFFLAKILLRGKEQSLFVSTLTGYIALN